jgi:hypothetical protein
MFSVAQLGYRPDIPGIVLRLTASGRGFLLLQSVHARSETYPNYWTFYSLDTLSHFSGGRQSSVEIRKEYNCVSSPPYDLMTRVGLYVYPFEKTILSESKQGYR